MKASALSNVNIPCVRHCDPIIEKVEGSCMYGWKVSHRKGCQSVLLW